MLRVDYPAGGRTTFSYSSNLNTTGVRLRGATRLEVGQELPLRLHLRTAPEPVELAAMVRHVGREAAGLQFLPGQTEAVAAVQRFLQEEIVGKLEASLARSAANVGQVDLLAAYYLEVGRNSTRPSTSTGGRSRRTPRLPA